MKELLSEKVLNEMIKTLLTGKDYNYSDENTEIHVTPNSINIRYKSNPSVVEETKEEDMKVFRDFCEKLDDDLFMYVCESFEDEELDKLQRDLDSINYKKAINTIINRTKEVAKTKMDKIIKEADAEIKRQEDIIKNANSIIADVHHELEKCSKKYMFN